VSFLSDRIYGLRRAAAQVAQRPLRFTLSVLLATVALCVPLLATAFAYVALTSAQRTQLGPEISAFIAPGTSTEALEALRARLSALPGVAAVRLIPREDAYADLMRRSGATADAAQPRPNPLPDVLVARFGLTADPPSIDRATAEIRTWPAVDAVQADLEWYRRLNALVRGSAGLAGAVAILLASIVILALLAAALLAGEPRRDEAALLDLVGAGSAFIVRPCAYVSALALGFAAVLAIGLVAAALALLEPRIAEVASIFGGSFRWPDPPWWIPAAFALAALFTGWVLGWLTARVRLKRVFRL
jgi:cell division transport system permease protein